MIKMYSNDMGKEWKLYAYNEYCQVMLEVAEKVMDEEINYKQFFIEPHEYQELIKMKFNYLSLKYN